MKIGAQGQVVIPAELVEQAGFGPGDELSVRIDSGVLTLRAANDRPETTADRGRPLVERLRGTGRTDGLSTDDIMAMTRGE